ncbi:MAG: hypothetical protein IPH37_18255 [Burkholderiales bacterium]|nr:hypothetical protein [Burkholderiales bacterium]
MAPPLELMLELQPTQGLHPTTDTRKVLATMRLTGRQSSPAGFAGVARRARILLILPHSSSS